MLWPGYAGEAASLFGQNIGPCLSNGLIHKTELPLWLSREDMPGAQLNYIIS